MLVQNMEEDTFCPSAPNEASDTINSSVLVQTRPLQTELIFDLRFPEVSTY